MRARLPAAALAGLALAVPALLVGACRDPTEITLVLTSDFSCDEPAATRGMTTISVAASFDAITEPSATTPTCPAEHPRSLGSVVLVPSDAGGEVAIGVVAGLGRDACNLHATDLTGCVVAKRRISFVAHKNLTLPIVLHAACSGVVCAGDTTCGPSGQCVSAAVDPGACGGGTCPGDDASATVDGSATDGSPGEAGADALGDGPPPPGDGGGDSTTCGPIAGGHPASPGLVDCYGGAPPGLECDAATKCCYAGQCINPLLQCAGLKDTWACDEPADCKGSACCVTPGANLYAAFCSLGGPCAAGSVPMCKTDCDCPKGVPCALAGSCPPLQTCGGLCP